MKIFRSPRTSNRAQVLLSFFFLFLIIPKAEAQMPPGLTSDCDFCMCSMGISPLVAMGGTSLRYDARYTELGTYYVNGMAQPNADNHVQQFFTQVLSFTYRIVPDLSATLTVPFARKSETSNDPGDLLAATGMPATNDPTQITNTGLADISLRASYYLLADESMDSAANMSMRILAATGGVKFRNGSTAFTDMGQPADPDIQLTTGTTDFMFGLGYLFGANDWTLGANGLFTLRGPGPGYDGHVYGNSFNYDVTGRYRIFQVDGNRSGAWIQSVFASFGIRGEWRGYELQNGQPLDNDTLGWSGGNMIYLAPGAQLYFSPRVSVDATVWVPIVHALYGNQIGETIRAIAGVQWGL